VSRERAKTRESIENAGAHQNARASHEVAEVANRPKKRPGRRLRSSITIRAANWQAILV
jgi:hypothetical protein